MYDIAIIGAGPAGMSAAVYAARYKMEVVLIGSYPGGYVNEAHLVENWLGEKSIAGTELVAKFFSHVKSLEVDVRPQNAKGIIKKDGSFEVITEKDTIEARRIILALGTERNKLGIKGEAEFLGKGVSYCTTCDGFFFKDKTVVVVGGSDSACTGSLMLGDIAKKVYLVYRQDKLRAEPTWVGEVEKHPNIEVILNANPVEIIGDTVVKSLKLDDGRELTVDGVFVEIGTTPGAALTSQLGVKTDEKGYVIVDDSQKTNVSGVWAAGDITTKNAKLKQIIVAASEGSVATYDAYLDKKSKE